MKIKILANFQIDISLSLTIKTPERRHWRCPGVLFVNFKHVLHRILVFVFLTLSR